MTGKEVKNAQSTKVHVPLIISKVATHVLKENPTQQRTIVKPLNISIGIANKIIKSNLKLIKTEDMIFTA